MPYLYLYNIIIFGFCWANMMQDAHHQFKLMQKEGIHPNATFTILISLVLMAGLVKLIVQ